MFFFLVLNWKNEIPPLLLPWESILATLGKSTIIPPLRKNPSDDHVYSNQHLEVNRWSAHNYLVL